MLPEISFSSYDFSLIQKAKNILDDTMSDEGKTRLSPAHVRSIHRRFGIEIATAALYAWFVSSEDHGPFIRNFFANCFPWSNEERNQSLFPSKVLLVPGSFYDEYPQTGSGGDHLLAELRMLGIPAERVPARSVGTLQENSQVLIEFLKRETSKDLMMVSLSKGGSDIKWALREYPAAFEGVRLWINIGGTLRGTPLIDWVCDRPLLDGINRLSFYLRGRNYHFFRQLAKSSMGELHFDLDVPNHLETIHVAGFPIPSAIRKRYARFFHRRFAKIGPSDSILLLEDLLELPGQVLPIWGTDHYYGPRWDYRQLVHGFLRYWSKTRTCEQVGSCKASTNLL